MTIQRGRHGAGSLGYHSEPRQRLSPYTVGKQILVEGDDLEDAVWAELLSEDQRIEGRRVKGVVQLQTEGVTSFTGICLSNDFIRVRGCQLGEGLALSAEGTISGDHRRCSG